MSGHSSESGALRMPTYRPVGDGYLWSCDLCGCAVESGSRTLHDHWHFPTPPAGGDA